MATKKKATAKAGAKKAAASKTAASKTASKKAAPKAAKKTAVKKSSAKKSTAKSATAKKSTGSKSAASKKPAKPAKSPFGQKFIDAQTAKLLEERARYTKSAEVWKAEADSLLEGREPGDVQFDEESGEGDTLAIERERDLALSSHARAAVEEIDAALVRVEKGVYGVCITSGKPIPKERLEVIPWAAERVEEKAAGFGRR